jgi:deoxyribodipyrimidine photo-lyase
MASSDPQGSATTPTTPTTIVWFRHDLRVADNPALEAAVHGGGGVLPVFIWAPHEEGAWAPGGASRWWLHHALVALDAELRRRGNRLTIARLDGEGRRGVTTPTTRIASSGAGLEALAAASGARSVYWNRRYEPAIVARDTEIKRTLRATGLDVQTFNSQLLHEPWALQTQAGQPFRVFTPFWRACLAAPAPPAPRPAPARIPAPERGPVGPPERGPGRLDGTRAGPLAALLRPEIGDLGLLPTIDWAGGLRAAWTPGEATAQRQLEGFLARALGTYASARDLPARPGTSRLSPHLHVGALGPRQVWWAVRDALDGGGGDQDQAAHGSTDAGGADAFLRELGWREFSHHLLFHFPGTPTEPLRPEFTRFPWRSAPEDLRAWQLGRTGYPLVDAGMRELWQTGGMHNRVRMVVASFLVKHLLLPWQAGARWFWDTLVDADLAQNTFGWQWTTGCGADAAPYFRVFNPVLQGQKFDPGGAYVRTFVPELGRLPDAHIHAPWLCAERDRLRAGVRLGESYPWPMVDHAAARARALAAYASL